MTATTDDLLEATYSDLKIIKTRKTLQIIVEVPLENFDRAMQILGGAPMPDRETWLIIARLDRKAALRDEPEPQPGLYLEPGPEIPRARKSWGEMTATQRAVLRCEDHRFWSWLATLGRIEHSTEEETMAYVRRISGGSRSNLGKSGFDAETEAWETVDRAYSKYLEHQKIESMR